jgi:hypothetical protein
MPSYPVNRARLRDEITRIEREGGQRIVQVVDLGDHDELLLITEYVGPRQPYETRAFHPFPGACTLAGCRICGGEA